MGSIDEKLEVNGVGIYHKGDVNNVVFQFIYVVHRTG